MTRTSKEAKALVRDAQRLGLKVELKGDRWHVTTPHSTEQAFLPIMITGRAVDNYRAHIRRIAPPMVAAVAPEPQEEPAMGWPIEELISQAGKQGVRITTKGGVLSVSGPVDAEPLARLLRDRGVEVLAHLNPPTEELPVPKISEIAVVEGDLPGRDVTVDARRLWQVIRGLAATQEHPPGQNAGAVGAIWHGALLRVVKEAFSDWDDDWRRDVSTYLERSNHMKCQSRSATPPIWWVRESWNDGGLTVTKPAAKAPAKTAAKAAVKLPAALPLLDVTDPLAMLTAVAKRVSDAEARAGEAELMVAMLEEELEKVRGDRDQYKAQVEQINDAFRMLAGGSK